MQRIRVIQFTILALIPVLLASCTFSRSDLFFIATGQPDIHVIPNSSNTFAFGSVDVYMSVTQTFTVENIGSRTLKLEKLFTSDSERTEFILNTDQTASLVEPGETTTFSISFKPSTVEQSSVGVMIESNDPDEHVYQFSVAGVGTGSINKPPKIEVKRGGIYIYSGDEAYNFGTMNVGSTSSVVFTVKNVMDAEADLFISDISFISGDVMQFNRIAPAVPGSLSPGGEMQFTIEFSPQAEGSFTGVIEIVSDDTSNNPFTFSVTGDGGVAPPPNEPEINVLSDGSGNSVTMGSIGYDFTTISVGTSSTTSFIVENKGEKPLNIDTLDMSSGDISEFRLYPSPFTTTLEQGQNFTFDVTYSPSENKIHQVEIKITHNDIDDNPFNFFVQGKGTLNDVPDMQVQVGPKKYADGSVYYFNDSKNPIKSDDSIRTIFTIKNTGKADLEVSGVLLVSEDAKDFSTDLEVPFVLRTGSTVNFNVWFSPQIEPAGIEGRKARIQLFSNDPDEIPYIVFLVGYVEPY